MKIILTLLIVSALALAFFSSPWFSLLVVVPASTLAADLLFGEDDGADLDDDE